MGDGRDDFQCLRVTANLDCAKLEIGLFMQSHVQLDAAIVAADVEDMDCRRRALANGNIKLVNCALILNNCPAKMATCRHDNAFRRR